MPNLPVPAAGAAMPAVPQVLDPSRRAILSRMPAAAIGVGSALTALVPADPAAGDHELIRLGNELETAWANERALVEAGDDAFDVAMDRTRDIVHQIENIPATSTAGLKVKARAVSWCHSGEPFESDAFNEQNTTNVRLAASIMNDILAL